ncbi:hypothetical protein AbraIFM66951_010117 [Aspergillus brasiliensis]|uniref:Uncharacterized protein n=1 Tax=Aspergillus brasiliensis TaxID=319629 RepID=A0A9W5YP02_9EURO|nr:hypothetical protein AbraCBS73388_007006 [Aspergillus brasiliensis]GKZ46944.1 hypothetical protein AbraIFM66951_010117 [Aspergillus brasiliensis]
MRWFKHTKRRKEVSPPTDGKVRRKKSPQVLGKIENFEIPKTPEEWEGLVQTGGLQHIRINTLPKDMFASASKPSNRQYVMLRTYSPKIVAPSRFRNHMSKFGFINPETGKRYIQALEQDIPTDSLREGGDGPWPGAFMAAKRLQEQTATVNGTHDRTRRARNLNIEEYSDAEDEASPNAAVVVLLQQITHLVENTGLEWVLNRIHFVAEFGGERRYTAYTDGALRSTSDSEVFSIVETKRAVRYTGRRAIIAQEACEVIAWFLASPNSAVFNDHFLLISQNRHQIFLTFTKYKKGLEDYFKKGEATDEFLVMETFGPWDAENPRHVAHFAKIIIAAILIVKAAA